MSAKKAPEDRIRDVPPFGLRMPAELHERVKAEAQRNHRSMNAEIVHALAERYPTSLIAGGVGNG